MEVKKVFALASVTVLSGLVSAVTAVGCSSTTEVTVDDTDGGKDATPDRAKTDAPVEEKLPEEKTVGKLCKTDQECEVAGSVGDNVCSIGFFTIGDLYGDPVCVSPCTRGPGQTFADILCDGDDAQTSPGVCLADNPGDMGPCLPACEFGSTKIDTPCQGANKCGAAYFGTIQSGEAFSLGICLGACTADTDCKGSTGQKCQVETGLCVATKNFVTYSLAVGAGGCKGADTPDKCNCNTVGGTGANKDAGYCTHHCITGAAGDTKCGGLKAGWKCSAGLPKEFTNPTKPAFTGQPDGILGTCALPCTQDTDCAPIAAAINTGGTTGVTAKCEDTAGFKICVANQ